MHSNIFAMSQGVPVIAIGYRHKTLGVAASLGMEKWVIDINELDATKLTDKLDGLWQERHEIRANLLETLPERIKLANLPGSLIADDYMKVQFGL